MVTVLVAGPVDINNSVFKNNTAVKGGGVYTLHLQATNNLIVNNSDGIHIYYGDEHMIVNNVFINNNNVDINITNSAIATIKNNYLDTNNIYGSHFKSSNIFMGVTLDFINEANNNYHLASSSDLIDAGTTDIDNFIFPSLDIDGNPRILGSRIDIGPYEFQN